MAYVLSKHSVLQADGLAKLGVRTLSELMRIAIEHFSSISEISASALDTEPRAGSRDEQ